MEILDPPKMTQNIFNWWFFSNASTIINSVLKVEIHLHKLHVLSITEGSDKDKWTYDNRIIAKYFSL